MTLQAFSFPFPEDRLLRAGGMIYKFKILGGSTFSGEEVIRQNHEIEDIIRTVLGNLDHLQPFSSAHFNIFPCIPHYKKRWQGLPKVMCSHREKKLRAYPFVLILYLEKNIRSGAAAAMTHTVHHNARRKQAKEELSLERDGVQLSSGYEPQPKRFKTDSPLEEAILKDLIKELEAEGKLSTVGLHLDNPHAKGEVQDPGHKNEKGTEVHPGTSQEEEEENEEEGEHVDPRRPAGILSRLARAATLLVYGATSMLQTHADQQISKNAAASPSPCSSGTPDLLGFVWFNFLFWSQDNTGHHRPH
ncbi:hypothetical protein INR49_011721 [Caranx melampygus]|nr:hypothetical protein INR49_011721 [Caranx melampygus]